MPQALVTHRRKLSSNKEWLLHRAHALLGAFVLGHFCYRYSAFFRGDSVDMGFEDMPARGLLIFVPHIMLQLSGLFFRVPPKRHPDGSRIWNEYRWHALIFCCRCFMLLLLLSWRKLHPNEENVHVLHSFLWSPIPAFVAVMATMMAADAVTSYFRQRGESSNTIRDLRGPAPLRYLMSSAQFHATTNRLLTSDRMSVQLAALAVVQSSAFGMTLRRKGIICQNTGLFLYSMILIVGMIIVTHDYGLGLGERDLLPAVTAVGNTAALLRLNLGLNKYILWTIMAVLLPTVEKNISWTNWLLISRCSTFLLLWSALYQTRFKMKTR